MRKLLTTPAIILGALAFGMPSRALVAQTVGAPPAAPVREVVDTYYGVAVHDPYRWMEGPENPELDTWLKAQAVYTRGVLDRIPSRATLVARLQQLLDAGTIVYDVQLASGEVFYQKIAKGDEVARLYVRRGFAGAERLLVDPDRFRSGQAHVSLSYYAPAPDGRHVAFGVSAGGSEKAVLRVVETATARVLPDEIDRAQFGSPSWLADGRSFLFNRLQPMAPGADRSQTYLKSRVYRHVVGTSAERDVPLIGFGVGAVPVDSLEGPFAAYSAGSPWVLGVVTQFVKNEVTLYAARAAAVVGGRPVWHKLAGYDDDATRYAVHGDALYLLTHKDAPRYKVVRTSIARPDLATADVVVPESEAVITNLGAAQDGLYVQLLDGGLGRLVRVPWGGKPEPVALPFDGAIGEFITDPREPGVLVKLTSWTEPQLWYRYDPRTRRFTDTRIRPRSPVDYSNIESHEVKVAAADGTLVPLSIVHRKGLEMDGSHPTLLEGYGSYGITLDPGFNPLLLAWLERGGVYAVAHVRGGGEYGEAWHQAGQKLTKQNTIGDFIACAEYLVSRGYTSPRHLAGQGGSAGGITIGGAITQRPDLFGAAIDNVGASDMLRIERGVNGPTNIAEFGSVATEDGFKGLLAMSAYHHVKDGTSYPAVLLTTGINDPRVPSWQVAKMAARLQAATAGPKPILLRVDYDAGHGIGSTRAQAVAETADEYAFLFWQLGQPEFQPPAEPRASAPASP
ncbi:MAG TPA: prolyl oligopeptidase family serine peptidase [Gemmatimonadales bacterium]|nr:prolyl oligopeptidase family serine peptidase [Gemmatimonadales bacterium]